jgi:hypothetical protein
VGISTYDNDGGNPSIYGPGGADYGPQNATNGLEAAKQPLRRGLCSAA